nr:MAG TPA: hypothetical protein [Caudoviricetes sp.]
MSLHGNESCHYTKIYDCKEQKIKEHLNTKNQRITQYRTILIAIHRHLRRNRRGKC